MTSAPSPPEAQETALFGFAVLDNKGRLSLSKPVRRALGMRPGSSVAYVLIDQTLLVIPQDEHLARLMDDAAAVLQEAGLTPQDFLDELPAVRAEVVEELYGAEFMAELERQRLALHAAAEADRDEPADRRAE